MNAASSTPPKAKSLEPAKPLPVDLLRLDLTALKGGLGQILERGEYYLAPNLVLIRAIPLEAIQLAGSNLVGVEASVLAAPVHVVIAKGNDVADHIQPGFLCVHRSAAADFVDGLVDNSPYCVVDQEWLSIVLDPAKNKMIKSSLLGV